MIKLAGQCWKNVALGLLAVLWIGGCAPAKVTSTWRDPGLSGPLNMKKIAVICIHPSPAVCKVVEDEMVKQIGTDRAIAGYTLFSEAELKQVAVVKSRLAEQGFDGAVTLKLAGSHTQSANASSEGGSSFFDDYDRNVASMDDPSGTATRVVVSVQTSIYRVSDAKLIWRGNVDLYDPQDAVQITDDIVKAVGDELRKEKLIQ
jgi:hypothetical protein